MPKVKVAGVILNGDRVLVGKRSPRKDSPLSGEWEIPSTAIIGGESDAETLARMTRAIAGIDIIVGRHLITNQTITKTTFRWYECFSKSKRFVYGRGWEEIKLAERKEVLDIVPDEIKAMWPEEIINYFGAVEYERK